MDRVDQPDVRNAHDSPLTRQARHARSCLIILAVVILLFGAAKLPELARGSGRALRIFKAETKGLMDDDKDDEGTDARAPPSRAPSSCAPAGRSADRRPSRPSSTPSASARDGTDQRADRRARCPSPASSTSCAGKPRHPVGRDGRMALSDHLRELRAPVLNGRAARWSWRVVGVAVLLRPALRPGPGSLQRRPASSSPATSTPSHASRGAGGPLMLHLKLCGVVALVAYQPATGSTRSGRSSCRGCTRTSASGRASSPPSPGRCSSPASRWATTCCPRAWRS